MDIANVHQGYLGIVLHQKRHHAAAEGIPEDNQFPIGCGIGIFNGQQAPGAGEENIIQVPAFQLVQIVDTAGFSGFVVVDAALAQQVAVQVVQRLRLHGQSRLTVVDTVEGLFQGSEGVILLPGRRHAQGFTDFSGRRQQVLLPPVGIGAIVVAHIQRLGQIDVGCPGHPLLHHSKQLIIIHGQVAAGLGQVITLVRGNGHKYPGILQIGFIDVIQPLQSVAHRHGLQGVFLLGGVALRKINAVVVLLPQGIEVEQRFELPEAVPQGELIQGVVLKILHEFPVQNGIGFYFRHLGQGAALRHGQILLRQQPGGSSEDCP